MRVLIFHGYLLSGTGSNVYNARLAEALVGLGHEVHLLSQDRHPQEQRFVDAICQVGANAGTVIFVDQTLRDYRALLDALAPVFPAQRNMHGQIKSPE